MKVVIHIITSAFIFLFSLLLSPSVNQKHINRLAKEKSPYLLQHAHNPVDWYPWGEEAFEKARKEDKPIFLSIGYSTCHWCHVMERESFEQDSIAEILNKFYVAIKVDREERPDVDNIYMSAVQAMTGSGGWPLSAFLTPDLKPFFGGTYFPPRSAYGRPGFSELLQRIREVWTSQRVEVLEQADHLINAIKNYGEVHNESSKINSHIGDEAYNYFSSVFDHEFGGFGGAPKFPRPVIFNFLFAYWLRTKKEEARNMALETLRAMATGGMNDQLGGGFHRYSVDNQWRVSHFEKMLYDQAQLANSYLDAFQITHDNFYADVARSVLEYVMRDMTHSRGGFYSAEDADSEGEEGKFYVWTEGELEQLLGTSRSSIVSYYYGIRSEGNYEHGKNVLHITHSIRETAKKFSLDEKKITEEIHAAKKILFEARAKRIRPHLDDKILVAWNGLMISAFARAGVILGEERYSDVAKRAAEFIFSTMYADGQLIRRWRDEEAKGTAFLDDYAFLVHGLVDLYQASGEILWLDRSIALAEKMIELFYDETNGGFYFTPSVDSDNNLILKTKQDYDGAEPAGNSLATLDLLRLAELTGSELFRQKAVQTLEFFSPVLARAPHAMPELLVALEWASYPVKQVVVVGTPGTADTKAMLREIDATYLPRAIVLHLDAGKAQRELASRVEFFGTLTQTRGKATAYICQNYTCQLPTTDISVMQKMLAH